MVVGRSWPIYHGIFCPHITFTHKKYKDVRTFVVNWELSISNLRFRNHNSMRKIHPSLSIMRIFVLAWAFILHILRAVVLRPTPKTIRVVIAEHQLQSVRSLNYRASAFKFASWR
jgi:hypothetical protein